MYKTRYIFLLCLLLLGGCSSPLYNQNYDARKEVAIDTVYEYSYTTKEGELIFEYDPSKEMEFSFVRAERLPSYEYNEEEGKITQYYSLGLPDLDEGQKYDNRTYYDFGQNPKSKDYPIYFDKERVLEYNPTFYIKTETDYGEVSRLTWIEGGHFFEIINTNEEVAFLDSADHLEIFESNSDEECILAWFDNRIVIDAHVYSLIEGNMFRTTINGNEEMYLDGTCYNMSVQNEYLYYLLMGEKIDDKLLFRIKLGSSEPEQVSSIQCIDYCLTSTGAIFLSENDNVITIFQEEFGEDSSINKLGEFEKAQSDIYQISGMIEGQVYLSVRNTFVDLEDEKVKIYSFSNDDLVQIHESEGTSNIKYVRPFVHEGYIFYLTNEGVFMFNPQSLECDLVAKPFFVTPQYIFD